MDISPEQLAELEAIAAQPSPQEARQILAEAQAQQQRQAAAQNNEAAVTHYGGKLAEELADFQAAKVAADQELLRRVQAVVSAILDYQRIRTWAAQITQGADGSANQVAWAEFRLAHPGYDPTRERNAKEARHQMEEAKFETDNLRAAVISRHNPILPGSVKLMLMRLPQSQSEIEAKLHDIVLAYTGNETI